MSRSCKRYRAKGPCGDNFQQTIISRGTVWVGVRCDATIAEAGELRRPDRVKGLARYQAERVHKGVSYDIVVDTTDTSTAECATLIGAALGG